MRKLKAVGLALVAVFALSAMLASTASAKYDSEAVTTALTGTATNTQVFNTKFGEVKCTAATFTGSQTGSAVEGGFTAATLQVHPEYTGCKALGFNATVDTSGCDYKFATPTKTEVTGPHTGVDVVKTGAAACDINIVAAGGLCSVNVPEQTEVGLVDFMSEGAGKTRHVVVASTANEIEYTGVGGFCSGAGTGGTYTGEVDVIGKVGANQVGVWVTNT